MTSSVDELANTRRTLGLADEAQRVLPSQALERAVDAGIIEADDFKIPPSNIQPASIDLRLRATLGTRRGETCALRWEDFDFREGRVHVRRALCKGVHGPKELKPPKTGRERTLVVGRVFFDQVRSLRKESGWLFADRRFGSATSRKEPARSPARA